MKKLFVMIIAVAATLTFSSGAFAKKEQNVTFDMKELTCKDLISFDEDTAGIMLMWIDGYLSGVTGDTRFDGKQFESFAGSLGEHCAKNPNSTVLDASHKLGIN